MSRPQSFCRDNLFKSLQLELVCSGGQDVLSLKLITLDVATSLLLSRHYFLSAAVFNCASSCRDVTLHVATSALGIVPLKGCPLDVMTSAQVFGALLLLVVMLRRQYSCRDISLCCCRLHWLLLMSRLQLPCRDIILLNFCSFFSCLCLASCHELHQFPFTLHDVVTS